MDRIAAIADIHGNRWALESILEDIEGRGVDQIVNLGDSFYGPLDPGGTAEMLIPMGLPTVCGNEDRIIVEPAGEDPSQTLSYVRGALGEPHLTWIESLPLTATLADDAFMCHGCPDRDDVYLLEIVEPNGVHARDVNEVAALLAPVNCPLVLCAHSHVPGEVRLPNGAIIVNPGSVGLQAYTDDSPCAHAMTAGTPHARYAVLTRRGTEWQPEFITVPYDWERAARAAADNGRPDWASWLRTGLVESD